MSLELNEKKLLIILKKYEHTSMYFESLLFDFYRITEINYDKPLNPNKSIVQFLLFTCKKISIFSE